MVGSSRGYSLPEAVMAVAITAILAAISAPLLIQMTNFWRQTIARNEIQRDVRSSIDSINRSLRQAVADSVVLDNATGQPPFTRIQFTTVQGTAVTIYQSGDKLMMKSGGNISVLSRRLAFIAFSYPRSDDSSIISVAMTMQAPTYLGGKKALQLSIQKVRIMD